MKIVGIAFIFLLTGCMGKNLYDSYDKMQIDKGEVSSYSLDLRISGNVGDESINEIVRIHNSNNNFKIIFNNSNNNARSGGSENETIVYIVDKVIYVKNEEGNYVESNIDVIYSNPGIYLEGVKNAKKINSNSSEKIGDNTYRKYNITVSKDIVDKIIKNTSLKKIELNKDITAIVYLNNDGFVHRIVYYLYSITIDASYYGINMGREIGVPINGAYDFYFPKPQRH